MNHNGEGTSMAMPTFGTQYTSTTSPLSPHDYEDRRVSYLARRQSQFNEHMNSSPTARIRGYSMPQQPTHQAAPQKSSNRPRDSVIEPDAYATFTSSDAATNKPTIYQPAYPCPLKVTKYAVHDANTGQALITIVRNAVHMPEPFSSKPLITLMKSDTGAAVGSIRFHLTTSAVDLELSGVGSRRMEHDGHFTKRWKFSSFFGGEPMFLYWCNSKKDGWELREGGKKGEVIARIGVIDALSLKFERASLDEREVEEIVLSAVAIFEAIRRSRKNKDWGEGISADGTAPSIS